MQFLAAGEERKLQEAIKRDIYRERYKIDMRMRVGDIFNKMFCLNYGNDLRTRGNECVKTTHVGVKERKSRKIRR